MDHLRVVVLSLLVLASTCLRAQEPSATYLAWVMGPPTVQLGVPERWSNTYSAEVRFTQTGEIAVGVPFRYRTDPACGTFSSGTESTGVVDEVGQAYSGLFFGVALTSACPIWFQADGMNEQVVGTVRVFDPATVHLTTASTVVDAAFGDLVRISVDATADGVPVNAYPMLYEVGQSPSGATATFFNEGCGLTTARCIFGFWANSRPGNYPIRISYGNASVTVLVKQRPN